MSESKAAGSTPKRKYKKRQSAAGSSLKGTGKLASNGLTHTPTHMHTHTRAARSHKHTCAAQTQTYNKREESVKERGRE